MASLKTRILNTICIPSFSNDVRGLVMDYLYFRFATKIEYNGQTNWLGICPGLRRGKLCLFIVLQNATSRGVLSSFAIDCEEKALEKYTQFKGRLAHSTFHLEPPFDETLLSLTNYCLHVFCPEDQSTIMLTIDYIEHRRTKRSDYDEPHYTYNLRLHSIKRDDDRTYITEEKHLRTYFTWKSQRCIPGHRDYAHAEEKLIFCYKLAAVNGAMWEKYDSKIFVVESDNKYDVISRYVGQKD